MPRISVLGIVSLVTLVIQNAAVALLTRQSRINQREPYHTSTVILNQEILKMVFCLAYFAYERRSTSFKSYWRDLSSVVAQPDTWKLSVPAALFTFQTFLIFISLANLDVVQFQMLSQTKLLSAALFTVWIMKRHLSRPQWGSLLILTLGVILAQLDTRGIVYIAKHLPKSVGERLIPKSDQSSTAPPGVVNWSWVGVVACIVSGLSSSFAGVYFEKVVKTSAPSLAVRNIHLSMFGIPFSFVSMLVLDVFREGTANFQFFKGYTFTVWLLVCTHAAGGLLVAAVVKYADNIQKGFATAVATIVSGVYAAIFWSYVPTIEFLLGCSAVFGSVIMFHAYEQPQQQPITVQRTPGMPTTPGNGSGAKFGDSDDGDVGSPTIVTSS